MPEDVQESSGRGDVEVRPAHVPRPPARFNSSVEWVIVLGSNDHLALRRRVNGVVDESYLVTNRHHLLEMVEDVAAGYCPSAWGSTSRRAELQDVLQWAAPGVTAGHPAD